MNRTRHAMPLAALKRVWMLAVAALSCSALWAQADDPVVMTVAGQAVTRGEFEYAYNKNKDAEMRQDRAGIEEYVDLFINYRLKVQAALDARLDTLGAYRREFATYRDIQLRPYLQDDEFIDSLALAVYNNIKAQVGDADLIELEHIFLHVPQTATEAERTVIKTRIDSIYAALQGGADFGDLARKHSQDTPSAARGGQLPVLGPKQTLPEFEKAAYALQPGQYCAPFLSTVGYHILRMKKRYPLEPFEVKKNDIIPLLKERGLEEAAAEHRVKTLMREQNKSREEVIADVLVQAERQDASLAYLVQEYHDGLLLYEASKRFAWDKAAQDTKGLEKYFKKNKKAYTWSEPHFKGYVISARSQALADAARNFLGKYKGDKAVEAFQQTIPKDSVRYVHIKFGVFKQGENTIVDECAFGCQTTTSSVRAYKGKAIAGRIQKQPKTYLDVKDQVTSDYQDAVEQEWVAALRKRYTFRVDRDVLRTVNNH